MPETTIKQFLEEHNGALVVTAEGKEYIYYLGILLDGIKVVSLDSFNDDLLSKNNQYQDVIRIYSKSNDDEALWTVKGRKLLWKRVYKPVDVLNDVIDKYGYDAQQDIAIEEMSELIKALIKRRRAENKGELSQPLYDDIAEEIADVEITLAQLKIMFHNSEAVDDWREKKLDRLEERLKNG